MCLSESQRLRKYFLTICFGCQTKLLPKLKAHLNRFGCVTSLNLDEYQVETRDTLFGPFEQISDYLTRYQEVDNLLKVIYNLPLSSLQVIVKYTVLEFKSYAN